MGTQPKKNRKNRDLSLKRRRKVPLGPYLFIKIKLFNNLPEIKVGITLKGYLSLIPERLKQKDNKLLRIL